MKNSILIFIILLLFKSLASANELDISAKNISIDKKNQISTFKNEVVIKDDFGNTIETDNAIYNNEKKNLEIIGKATILTSEGYFVETEDLRLDKNKNIAYSDKSSTILDNQKNKIYLENFHYTLNKNIFKSIGKIKVVDKSDNYYEFTQIYINEKKKELIGSDSKAYLNDKSLKVNKNNKPRIFSNSISIKENDTNFFKSTFTMCDYRANDKCPPWQLSATSMKHDNIKKTIYYDNAVIKVYNIPIFYFPKLAHPDPTVKRRSGLLVPTYLDTKNLGSGISLPYFWAISNDRDFTFKSKLFASENPLHLGEYRQAFKNSNLIFDFGYTEGYKKTTSTKKSGDKSHFFGKFTNSFISGKNNENNLEISLQEVSNRKYLKLYRVESELVDYETNTLENFVNFDHYNDEKDFFLAFKSSMYRNLSDTYNDKYEFILPDINFNKNLYNENFGNGNLNSNFKVRNYDTNKTEKFFINDFDWEYDKSFTKLPYDGKVLLNLKNVNYEINNVEKFKKDTTSEIFGSLGYLANLNLIKEQANGTDHLLKPKILLRYSPNHMRKETGDYSLYRENIFSLNRLNSSSNYESGSNLTYGFDYEMDGESHINFSIGQIINEKKNNRNMPDSSSLDKRFSDIIGNFGFSKDNFNFNYNYSLDQNFNEMNYNEATAKYSLSNIKFNLNYLEEDKVDNQKEYFKSSIEFKKGENGLLSFNNKRNMITNSSEYYNLSYEYINDCLRAGLVYRREFYNDSELEPENSLMFKITLSPFGEIASPKF